MNIDKLKQDIEIAESDIRISESFIYDTRQSIAEHLCPFKVGDKVISGTGEREIVADISYKKWGVGYSFNIFRVKKDGAPYKQSQYAYYEEKYTKA
jgi:hypothetical protein